MKKIVLIPILLFILLLPACGTPAPVQTALPIPPATELPTEIPAACVSISSDPTPVPDESSLFPPVTKDDHSIGLDTAQTTFIVYNDFKSQYSQYAAYVFSQMLSLHPQDMRVVMRNAPGDELSILAAQAAEAADLQGKFWEMHNALYNEQQAWVSLSPEQFQEWLKNTAIKLEMDGEKFQSDLQSEAVTKKVKDAQDYWADLEKKIQESSAQPEAKLSPPLILINGKPTDATALTNLPALADTTVSMNALIPRQFKDCPPEVIKPGKEYIATLKTEKGDVVIQLLPDKAPLTVNNFVYLAQQGWFDNITFHRVLPGFVAQTGDPSGTGMGNPGYFINNEIDPALKFDKAGVVGMANSGPDTNGSQFFITYNAVPNLDAGYTIFGQVISGMDVLESLTARDPSGGKLLPPGDKLLTVVIEEK